MMSSTDAKDDNAAASDTGASSEKKLPTPSLLQEVEEAVAQSLLIFLVADLRLMSATGRIETKYETLAVASDPPTRCSAAELAGILSDDTDSKVIARKDEGLSPAQIMAVLLVELARTVEARKRKEEQLELEERRRKGTGTEHDEFAHDAFATFEPDARGKMKITAKEEDMHSLLKAYADMIGQDMNAEIPHVEKRMSLMRSIDLTSQKNLMRQSADRPTTSLTSVVEEEVNDEEKAVGEDDEEEENEEEKGEEEEGRPSRTGGSSMNAMAAVTRGIRRRQTEVAQAVRTAPAEVIQAVRTAPVERLERANSLRKFVMEDQKTKTLKQYEELTEALFKTGAPSRSLQVSLAASLGDSTPKHMFTEDELLKHMENAVESRQFGRLDFLQGFFRDGTVSKLMAQSTSRLVWVNDWYPLKDLTYGICVDPPKKRVLVVFRGAITRHDWSRAVESRNFRKISNPIAEDYKDKTDTINVSSGFYQYLFRRRKDTGTCKYDEISNIACKYGTERIGEDFTLVCTGHSLGGALSTTFSFFASADDRFTRNGPVKVFNFGSPYVGGREFQIAFQHQEKRRKLQYARFFNHNDIVAHLAPNFGMTKHGGKFRHVGVSIRLRHVPYGLCMYRKWHPDVFYVKQEGFARSYWRAIRDNFILKFPLPPWRFAQMHTLDELQTRLMYGRLQSDSEEFALLNKTIDELYEMFVGPEEETSMH